MSIKDTIGNVVNNVKDTISEAGHRSAAEGEQAKRDALGDQMTTGEKAGSLLNQGAETIKANVDASKREVRSNV
jgi:hypothetical protein